MVLLNKLFYRGENMGVIKDWLLEQEGSIPFDSEEWTRYGKYFTYNPPRPSSLSAAEIDSINRELLDISKFFPSITILKDKIIQLIKDTSTYTDMSSALLEDKQIDEDISKKIIIAFKNIYPDIKEDRQLIYKLNEIGRKNGQYAKITEACLERCMILCSGNGSSEIKKNSTIFDLIPNYILYKANIRKCLSLLNDIDLLVNHYDFDILLNDDLFIKISNDIVVNEISLDLLVKDFNKKLNFAKQMNKCGFKPYKIIGEYTSYFLLSNGKGVRYTLHKSENYCINENRLYTSPSSV